MKRINSDRLHAKSELFMLRYYNGYLGAGWAFRCTPQKRRMDDSLAYVICFSVLCFGAVCGMILTVIAGFSRGSDYPVSYTLGLIANFALAYDNGATAWLVVNNTQSSARYRAAVHTWIIPTLMLCCFELTLTVYKSRKYPLLWLTFDVENSHPAVVRGRLGATRTVVWLCAGAVHFLLQAYSDSEAEDASRFRNGRIPWDAHSFSGQLAADVIPPAALLAFGLYFGRALWLYGTVASTDVHPSSLNAWIAVIVSFVALLIAYFATPTQWMYPAAVNGCLVLVGLALAITIGLVQINREQLEKWRAALDAAHEAEIASAAQAEQAAHIRSLVEAALADRTKQGLSSWEPPVDKEGAETRGKDYDGTSEKPADGSEEGDADDDSESDSGPSHGSRGRGPQGSGTAGHEEGSQRDEGTSRSHQSHRKESRAEHEESVQVALQVLIGSPTDRPRASSHVWTRPPGTQQTEGSTMDAGRRSGRRSIALEDAVRRSQARGGGVTVINATSPVPMVRID